MRLCFVVQRYGEGMGGGAEEHVRAFAERLAARGHEIHVATTCATSYVDWANTLEAGTAQLNGVTVHRFTVANLRHAALFGDLHLRLLSARPPILLDVQREWIRLQGPETPSLVEWVRANARMFDVVVCSTYLYWPTWATLRAVAGLVPTVFHPTAHDEPMLGFSLFDETFGLPTALAYLTPEERDLVYERFGRVPDGAVVGVGVDVREAPPSPIANEPYLCYVGRVDQAKGVDELLAHFSAYKERRGGPLTLLLVGDVTMPLPERNDVRVLGLVDDAERDAAVAGAIAVVQPSFYESFSMVLVEAFAAGKPAIVNGRSAVLAGHARRSEAALTYDDASSFAVALDAVVEDPLLARDMGRSGRSYVAREYAWDSVLHRYEALLRTCVA